MSSAQKDIIYIDIDDEITGIIDKVQNTEHKVVALVLPKRAAVLQSIVNMKLLKKASKDAKKNIVLITSEAGLMPLAGAVGLHVAKTLQTKPAIPAAPTQYDSTVALEEDVPEAADDVPLDATKPIGVLAGTQAVKPVEETIEVDNTPKELAEPVKKPVNKKLKVPNFGKFRTRLFLGGAALILILVLWYFAAFVMPRANIIVRTDTSSVNSEIPFTTSPEAAALDTEEKIVPSQIQELKKTDQEITQATGEKDAGTKASGTITIRNCDYPDGFTINAGSAFTGGGKNYISTKTVTVPKFTGLASACTTSGPASGKASVDVQAQSAGDSYNAGTQNYSVPGIPSSAKVDAVGSAMTGGTTKIVKVVSQKDVDEARKKIEDRTDSKVEDELTATLADQGYYALKESLIVGTPEVTATPKIGEEASEVTVTSAITYTMIGVKEDDLKTLTRESVKDEVDNQTQMIQTTGLDEAVIRISDKQPDGKATANLRTVVIVGPLLDIENLKKEIAGKKRGQTQTFLQGLPGVKQVEVNYSPFWVYSTPKQTGKINITLEQASTSNGN